MRTSLICQLLLGYFILGNLLGGQTARAAEESAFGSDKASEAALIGTLYDLKQNQKLQPQKEEYMGVVARFLRQNWNETILNDFYRVAKPLYTTEVFIPTMSADFAPKAFGAEKIIKPSR